MVEMTFEQKYDVCKDYSFMNAAGLFPEGIGKKDRSVLPERMCRLGRMYLRKTP